MSTGLITPGTGTKCGVALTNTPTQAGQQSAACGCDAAKGPGGWLLDRGLPWSTKATGHGNVYTGPFKVAFHGSSPASAGCSAVRCCTCGSVLWAMYMLLQCALPRSKPTPQETLTRIKRGLTNRGLAPCTMGNHLLGRGARPNEGELSEGVGGTFAGRVEGTAMVGHRCAGCPHLGTSGQCPLGP